MAKEKAKEAVAPDRLDNVKKAIADSRSKVERLKEERASINDDIASERAHLVTLGIPKAAFDMALRYAGWDEDKRKGFDTAYAIVREAIGMPVDAQGDLFAEMGAVPAPPTEGPQLDLEAVTRVSQEEVAEGERILAERGTTAAQMREHNAKQDKKISARLEAVQ